jgi:hypothetical protein
MQWIAGYWVAACSRQGPGLLTQPNQWSWGRRGVEQAGARPPDSAQPVELGEEGCGAGRGQAS